MKIRNFAIVDELELPLSAGMTVLTGETGAGKSILLDALDLALGGRAESGVIRHGSERAEIAVGFDISRHPAIKQWLLDNELDADDECLIRRTASTDGRSKGFINGSPVPMQSLRDLGEQLVDIQGQHAHQSLLKRDMQREALDDFAGHQEKVATVRKCYQELKQLRDQQALLLHNKEERESRIELLTYQTRELEELSLSESEFEELEAEQSRLAHINQIEAGCEQAVYALHEADEQAVTHQINQVISQLDKLQHYDHKIEATLQLLKEGLIQIEEAASELRRHLDSMDMDPERLEWVDSRLGQIHDLSRKHHINPRELGALQKALSTELEQLLRTSDQSNNLDELIGKAETAYLDNAKQLTASRQKSARKLEKQVTENMHQLGMPNGQFVIDFTALEGISAAGQERVEFLVTMNPGQPLKPLSKVASGGELSRISLAIHVITAATGRIPTLIFDEVDVGIGGGTAEVVGRMLRGLSRDRQVLCVTHQPQVAALGHQHLQVNKFTSENTTKATVTTLNEKQRINEIARMLGGIEITGQTLSHAKDMIKRSQSHAD
ncbi:MAG: DNA repair protein RecN [Gammaproteobacteria bacterium]|nr:DNA repair protein RecN [Gammaproteobacteria bacterium]